MATVRLILRRVANKDGLFPIVVLISHKGTNTEMVTPFSIEKQYWDNGRIKRGCPQVENLREANNELLEKLSGSQKRIKELEERRRIDTMSARQIAEYIRNGDAKHGDIDFFKYLSNYIETIPNTNTKEKYAATLSALKKYVDTLYFPEITKPWLYRYKEWRARHVGAAAVNGDLRNIRALFNRAIDVDEILTDDQYPFRKFEMLKQDPRNLRLPIETIRSIRDITLFRKTDLLARDYFMLSFYLIGINNSDLYDLKGIKNGRIEYYRNKTGRFYSIKVEPEAMEVFERLKGRTTLLEMQERFASYNTLNKQINRHLKRVGGWPEINVPNLIMYHARHSWAGIAAKKPIGASKALIAQALGHGKTTVTDTYFDYDTELVDDLNRRVLDLLKDDSLDLE